MTLDRSFRGPHRPLLKLAGRVWAASGSVLLICALSGCRHRPDETEGLRFIETDPAEILTPDKAFLLEPILEWDLTRSDKSSGLDPNPPILNEAVTLEANEVHLVEVTIAQMHQGTISLRWSREGGPFGPDQQIQLQAKHQEGRSVKIFSFAPQAHPLWTGQITGLRIYTDQKLRRSIQPLAVRLLVRTVDPPRLESALSKAWKVDLDRDIRNALISLPGISISRLVVTPRRSRLMFGYGTQHGVGRAVEFRVRVRTDDRDQLVFSRLIQPRSPDSGRWHEAQVDLSAFGGNKTEIFLESHCDQPYDETSGFALWSAPTLINLDPHQDRPNVVLISVDTLRADHLSLYGYSRKTSPYLDAWASENAIVFDQAVAQASSTLPSHVSMLTGLNAFRHGVNHDPAPGWLTLLPEYLRQLGYHTSAQTGGGFLHPGFGFLQGFDEYRYWIWGQERLKELDSGLESAVAFVERNQNRPFFLLLHTYETHAPYRARQPFFEAFTGRKEDPESLLWLNFPEPTASHGFRLQPDASYEIRPGDPTIDLTDQALETEAKDRYDSSIAYVDSKLQELWRLLEQMESKRQTLVIFTSDHGESFGHRGYRGHGTLYDDNLLVPLAVSLPDKRLAGHRVARQIRSIDLLPTILDVLGAQAAEEIDGRSLLPLLVNETEQFPAEAWSYGANSNFGVALRIDKRLKYIFNDAVWPQIRGAQELLALSAESTSRPTPDHDAAMMSTLQSKTTVTLGDRLAGLAIELSNRESDPLLGSIQSPWLEPTRIKSVDLPCACLEWDNKGGFTFEVPPGISYQLMVEIPHTKTSTVNLQIGMSGGEARPEDPSHLELSPTSDTLGLERVEGDWQSITDSEGRVETGVRFRWHEVVNVTIPDSSAIDAGLTEQLEALGYLQ